VFEVGKAERAQALRIVKAFERARAKGKDRAKVGGALIEVPVYAAAKRLLGG
jgi:citrate lyase beta subunit